LNQQEELQDNVLGKLKLELDTLEGQTQPSKSDLSRMQELRDQIEYAETNTQSADQRDFTDADLNALIEEQLGKGKNADRDRQILRAYITARRAVPSGYKGNIAKEIADSFGIAESRVRQIGNPEKLADVAVSMGFDRAQVFDRLGIQSAQKALATELGKLEGELTRLKAKAKPTKADVARMAELDEQITRINDEVETGDMAAAFKEAGLESEAGEAFGNLDDAREWQKASTAGSQMAVKLVSIADTIAELKAAAAELKQLGLAQAEAAAAERINALTAEYQAIVSGYEAKPEAEATAPKASRKKAKAKTEVAQVAAEEKDAAKEAEAAKFRAERAAKLEADRKGLAVGDTVMNPKLGTGVVKSFAGDGDATTVTVEFKSGQTKELLVKLAKLEKTNAVQVQSTASVPVQPKTEAGQGVGGKVRRATKPAAEVKAPTQILTPTEQAGQAWDKVAAEYPTAPKFADLTDAQRKTFVGYGEGNWEKADVETELTKLAKSGMKFGKEGAPVREPYTAKQLLAELKDFIRADIPGRKLTIVDSVADLLTSTDKNIRAVGAGLQLEGAYGVAVNGRAFLVANRIKQGSGRAKFMHEVGGHLGLDNLLTKADQDKLVNQIKNWARKADGSLEAELALQAFERVQAAQTPVEDRRSELIAYFIESAMEMGVDPTAATDTKLSGPLREWFRTLWAAFKVAARKLGIKPESMTAQDVVNLAYGAARLEINGTWHGTAASFRKFSNNFMNSGEGAQAFGWGTYLAQRIGIAKGYWSADVERKTQTTKAQGFYDGVEVGRSIPEQNAAIVPVYKLMSERGLSAADAVQKAIQDQERQVSRYERILESAKQKLADRLSENVGSAPEQAYVRSVKDTLQTETEDLNAIKALDPAKFVVTPASKVVPEGSLMRVDTSVKDEELLDWDAPFSEQPKIVQDAIQAAYAELNYAVDPTERGGDTYGVLVDDFQYSAMGKTKTQIKELASKLLEKYGVKGIKFLDASSRSSTGNMFQNYKGRDGLRKAAQLDDFLGFDTFAEMLDAARVDGIDAMRKNFDMSPELDTELVDYLDWYNSPPVKTRNLVIFDDKDVFRVGSETAADRQRMKFGKNAPTKAQVASAVAKLPKQAQQPVNNSINTISDWARQGLDRLVFTSDLINRAVDAGIKSAKTFEGLLAKRDTKARSLEREVERIADTYAGIEEANKGDGLNSVNQFIFESTRTGKWGYDSGSFKADPKMAAQFNALGPKAQAYAKSIFTHGNKMLSDKKKAVIDYATSEYDARIAAETDPDKKDALTKDKVNDLKKFASLFKIREGIPYAPIKRFGDHVVVAKSKAYMDAVAAKDTKLVSQLEKDPDHYHVSFMETKNEARNLAAQLEAQGFFSGGTVAFKERSVADKELFGNSDSLGAITRLRAMADAKANAGDKGAAQMQRMVSDLYLQALAEGSARKSEMRRRGVSGEIDMLRSFAAQGRADANFVASVEYNPQVQDAIQTMRTEANQGSGDLNRKSEILNEVTRRYESSLDVTPTPTINKITRLSSIYYLATSPAYYMQNLTQPWMMSVPAMAGRHDYAKSSAALFTAYGQLGGVMKSARYDRQFDFSKVPGDVQAAIQELANRGKIDIGLETELGEFKIEGDGAFSKGWNKVDKFLRVAVQKVESINRLSTAMAAYRLELAKTGDKEAAINYADRILTETHGDYSSFNAPRFFNNPIGKVALQFRKFQLIQLTYYAKLLKDSGLDTKEKRAATKALVYSLGHTALLAGAMGLPGYSAIAWAIGALFGDDDDPLDVTAELRKFIGDEDMANLIMRGAPTLAGVDISGKVGAGNMLSIMPFSRADLTTKAGVIEAAGTLLGGAPVGMAARVADGLGQMMSGEWYKGMEQILPKGLGDAAKAYRISTEGMSRRNGDIVLPASEVSAWEALVQSMGIQPVQQSVVMERQQNTLEMNQFYQDRSTKVKAQYIKAIRAGESTAEARDAWNKLQEARVKNGYTRQPLSELLKSPQSQAKREKQVVDGVQFNKANKRFVEEQV
jgi:hypothetical protein